MLLYFERSYIVRAHTALYFELSRILFLYLDGIAFLEPSPLASSEFTFNMLLLIDYSTAFPKNLSIYISLLPCLFVLNYYISYYSISSNSMISLSLESKL